MKNKKDCTLFQLYSCFAKSDEIKEMNQAYKDGIGWGDAKKKLFSIINSEISPITTC